MKLTKEQLAKIIKEELNESYGDMYDQWNPQAHPEPEDDYSREMRHRAAHGMGDPPTTMSGSESANELRSAIAQFVADNPQLEDPKRTIMAIIDEALR